MANIKIDAKVLGFKKPVEIKQTNGLIKETLKMQIALAELGKEGSAEPTFDEFARNTLEYNEKVEDYIVHALKLTDAQAAKFDDLDQEETGDLLSQIILKVLGIYSEDEEEETGKAGKE